MSTAWLVILTIAPLVCGAIAIGAMWLTMPATKEK